MTITAMTPIGRDGSKYLLRLPPTLHARLKKLAEAEGVSRNTLIATLLAGAIGYDVVPPAEAPDEPPLNVENEPSPAADVLAQLRALIASPALDAAVAPQAA
jgi:hypothetical protein